MTGNRATVTERERQDRALTLRLEGKDYDEIARLCGYSNRSGAWKAVDAVLRRRESKSAAEHRAVEDKRLDAVLDRLNRELDAIEVGKDPAAVARLCEAKMRVTAVRIRLHNLTAPVTPVPNPDAHRAMDDLKRQFMRGLELQRLAVSPVASDERAAPSVSEPSSTPNRATAAEPMPAPELFVAPPSVPVPEPAEPQPSAPEPAPAERPRCSRCGAPSTTLQTVPFTCDGCKRGAW